MSAEIVNLRKARKARDRAAKKKQAEENRVRFGRPKAERVQTRTDEALIRRRLDAHRRDTPDGDGKSGSDESDEGGSGPRR